MWLLQVPVFEMGVDAKPAEIARQGLAKARAEDYDAVIVDTAGRLQVCSVPLVSSTWCFCASCQNFRAQRAHHAAHESCGLCSAVISPATQSYLLMSDPGHAHLLALLFAPRQESSSLCCD